MPIKVISKGLFKIICVYCKSELEYHYDDLSTDEDRDKYLICPVCTNSIMHKK